MNNHQPNPEKFRQRKFRRKVAVYWIIATIVVPLLLVLFIEGSLSGCSGLGLVFFWVHAFPISMAIMGCVLLAIWLVQTKRTK